jgi:hypothetical protein
MKKILLFAILLLSVTCHAQTDEASRLQPFEPKNQLMQFVDNIEAFNKSFPQEKVYLHLDNTGYFMGEKIWFKAYVVRDDVQKLSDLSGVLYVELVNPSGDVVQTRKLEVKEGTADGCINLEGLLNSGFYEIRAYTRYMTNWGNTGIFSRVLPILNKPEKDGDWSSQTMDMFSYKKRLPDNREKEEEMSKQMNVAFYPEGGHLISRLRNRVAFAVTNENGQHFETQGWLESDGEKVCDVSTFREGRGAFECVPKGRRLTLHLNNEKGNERSFRLPQAEEEGCVISVESIGGGKFAVRIGRTQLFAKQDLALISVCHGKTKLLRFVGAGSTDDTMTVNRDSLSNGVCQLCLLDANSNILAERMVFVYPEQTAERIKCVVDNQQLSPYGKIELKTYAQPKATFSLAVRDYDSQVNGWACNANSWMLLASDLKGYIENADYYLEADDEEHRRAADLLMMVQGWRRYNISKMITPGDFKIQQLLEQRMLLEGKLHNNQKKKEGEKAEAFPNVYVMTTSLNTTSDAVTGIVKTLDDGRFAIRFSPFYGPRELIMRPDMEGDISNYEFSINRWFSPQTRHINKNEILPLPIDTPRVWLGWKEDTTALSMGQREYMLKMVEVTAKRNRSLKAMWLNEQNAQSHAAIYYDCQVLNEQIRDRHELSPDFLKWLKQKNSFFGGNWGNEYANEDGSFRNTRNRVLVKEGVDYKRRPVVWIINNGLYSISYAPKRITEKSVWNAKATWEDFPATLDEVRSVYISEDNSAWKSTLTLPELEPFHPVTVYIYKDHQGNKWERMRKGVRSIVIEGFDVPETFESPDYKVLPSIPDYRRTLYWNPNVKTDENGLADIVFYNNRDCRQLVISAEGFTKEGLPIVY